MHLIKCRKHDYCIADYIYESFKPKARMHRPGTDCNHCWWLYYYWFAARHTDPADIHRECLECEQYRAEEYHRARLKRPAPDVCGITEREREVILALGVDRCWFEDCARRVAEAEIRNFPRLLRERQREGVSSGESGAQGLGADGRQALGDGAADTQGRPAVEGRSTPTIQ